MFERYIEKARRTIFFARYEASLAGSKIIEPEHLLLGLLRERKDLFGVPELEDLRRDIESKQTVHDDPVATSVDLPLAQSSKRVLSLAAEEAEGLTHSQIGTDHQILALLREPGMVKDVLESYHFDVDALRKEMASAQKLDGYPIRDKYTAESFETRIPNHELAETDVRITRLEKELRQINTKLDRLLDKLGD